MSDEIKELPTGPTHNPYGSDPRILIGQYTAAKIGAQNLERLIAQTTPHARDYPDLGRFAVAQKEHRARMHAAAGIRFELEMLIAEVRRGCPKSRNVFDQEIETVVDHEVDSER